VEIAITWIIGIFALLALAAVGLISQGATGDVTVALPALGYEHKLPAHQLFQIVTYTAVAAGVAATVPAFSLRRTGLWGVASMAMIALVMLGAAMHQIGVRTGVALLLSLTVIDALITCGRQLLAMMERGDPVELGSHWGGLGGGLGGWRVSSAGCLLLLTLVLAGTAGGLLSLVREETPKAATDQSNETGMAGTRDKVRGGVVGTGHAGSTTPPPAQGAAPGTPSAPGTGLTGDKEPVQGGAGAPAPAPAQTPPPAQAPVAPGATRGG
jgi:hypothetical protein